MITLNFWPLLNSVLTNEDEGYDASPALDYAVSLFPHWCEITPSEFERKCLRVLHNYYTETRVAPSRMMFYSLLGARLEPSEAADMQEFDSKVQMGMLVRYSVTDIQKILNAYEEGRKYYMFLSAQTTSAEIYHHPVKIKGQTLHGWEDAYNYHMSVMSSLELSSTRHDLRLSREEEGTAEQVYIETQERRLRVPPFYTGIPTIDAASGGFDAGDLIATLGATSHGKSMMVMNWIYNALLSGRSGAYFSLEMSTTLCMARFYSLHSHHPKFRNIHPPLDPGSIKSATLNQAQVNFLFEHVVPDFLALPGQLRVEKPIGAFGYPELAASLKRLENMDPDFPMTFFVVDHPALMDITPERGVSEFNLRDKMYSRIKYICDTFAGRGIVGIIPVQANEEGRKRAEKDPSNRFDLGGIGHSAEISRSSSTIYFISSFPLMKNQNLALIGCLKDRNGNVPPDFTVNVNYGRVSEEVLTPHKAGTNNPMPTFAL